MLLTRNVRLGAKRTSMRLEPAMWEALEEIARRESIAPDEVVGVVCGTRPARTTLTAAVRVFIVDYFRVAATEEGHCRAGHGGVTPPQAVRIRMREAV
ncbi:MAG: ribbon-helix-helix domain-containing protein [Alphaproteobacteria bacterium]|nr:ribbon-helix-helix domain-containing protein [Alphaproteobacteria bacterium]MBF0392994.1 ribbon-helix-helix domain-containing protein [Alphaproteobacteria bacterium]